MQRLHLLPCRLCFTDPAWRSPASHCTQFPVSRHAARSSPLPCPALQLQQAYVGMALAVAANRSFILPPVRQQACMEKRNASNRQTTDQGRGILHAPRLGCAAFAPPTMPAPLAVGAPQPSPLPASCPPLPQFKCFCDRIWYSVVRCRLVDAQSMPFPVPWCAAGASGVATAAWPLPM